MFSIGSFHLTEDEVRKRKAYLGIAPEDESRLQKAHPVLQKNAPEIIDRFYDYLLSHAHTREQLSQPGLIERLKGLQTRYFEELTKGRYDLAYFENRLRVGQTHDRVGLSPEWYLGAYNKYLEIVADVLSRGFARDYEGFFQTLVSLTKIIYLDMSLAIDAYIISAQDRLAGKTQELERANVDLKRLESARLQLTDMIVHDLQNPLSGIMAYLRVLEDNPALSESEREALREALRRCDDLKNMIMNVLQVSRADEGKLTTYVENLDLLQIARESAEDFRLVARQDGRTLEVIGDRGVPVRSDQTLVRRILHNLIRNALHHTPEGTHVRIKVDPADAGGPAFHVMDDGPGIPLEVQPLLFERFGAPALRNAGLRVDSGLGLAFCRAASQAVGASISVQSDGRSGTSFSVRFP